MHWCWVILAAVVMSTACRGGNAGNGPPAAGAPDLAFAHPADLSVEIIREPVTVENVVMHDLDGHEITLDDLRGRVVLVNFWATWCRPCRQEIPDLVKLQELYADHLQVIGVSMDEGGVDAVRAFADELGMNYPVVMATPELTTRFPGVFALPTTFVVDTEGRMAQTHVGLVHASVIEQETRYLAGLPTAAAVRFIEETPQTRLVNAAQATEIPGLDLLQLTPGQKEQALQQLNTETCTCGCTLTLAQCRINDESCPYSLPLAQKVVDGIVAAG